MSFQSCIFLQAEPDFSSFWFTVGITGSLMMELRFTNQTTDVFDLTIDRRHAVEFPFPAVFTDRDVSILLHAVVEAIALYTGKYPERSIRCKAGDQIQSTIFRMILLSNQRIMDTVFSIAEEEKGANHPWGRKPEFPTYMVKRKPDATRKPHPIHHTLNTYSQLFGNPVHIRLCEQQEVSGS